MKKNNNSAPILDFEQCERIGYKTEDKVFKNIVSILNDRHKTTAGLSYFDQLSIDLTQSDDILQDAFPEAYAEIMAIMREEYRALDELEQHCLFLYLFTNENDEDEIMDSMSWHLEDWMEERADDFLSKATDGKRYKS